MSSLEAELWTTSSDLIWGRAGPCPDTLARWQQGFQFSEHEPTALVQLHGGPCAVVTAVQAQMIRLALFEHGCRRPQDFEGDPSALLIEALTAVLQLLANGGGCILVFPRDQEADSNLNCASLEDVRQRLAVTEVSGPLGELLEPTVMSVLPALCGPLGLVSVVYSAVLTVGVDKVRQQVADDEESLVDPRSGNGSQALLNLLTTGAATPHFFDGVQNLDGLFIQGITEQPCVGFLTLLESLRYCEVGWHLKNPKFPVWIIGSETHLTVLCSDEAGLIQTDGRYHQVDRAFQRLDTGGSGFLSADKLEDLMQAAQLQLPPSCQSISELRTKLDPEGLQVLIRDNFLRHFFPDAEPAYPTKFSLYHVNNLAKGASAKVSFTRGLATIGLMDSAAQQHGAPEGAVRGHCDLLRVLHTKWPTLDVSWDGDQLPSVY